VSFFKRGIKLKNLLFEGVRCGPGPKRDKMAKKASSIDWISRTALSIIEFVQHRCEESVAKMGLHSHPAGAPQGGV
ncbi:MAG TPA: hypothetical protein VIW92_02090, partial [Thermoanaerobaculia bacterium]